MGSRYRSVEGSVTGQHCWEMQSFEPTTASASDEAENSYREVRSPTHTNVGVGDVTLVFSLLM